MKNVVLPSNNETTIKGSKWITTYQTMFGKNNEQELIVDFRLKNKKVFVRVQEVNVSSPYTQWFMVDGVDEAFALVEEVKMCL